MNTMTTVTPPPVTAALLVIDDEPGLRDMLAYELAHDGYAVETAESGEAAIARVRDRRFDLAITDLKMPGMGGVATVAALREMCPDIEIIVATGYATIESAIACMKSGAYDYIQKPYDMDEMRLTLARALQKSRLESLAALYGASRRILGFLRSSELIAVVPEVAHQMVRADEITFTLDTSGQPTPVIQPRQMVLRVEPRDAAPGTLVLRRLPGEPDYSNGDVRRCELFTELVAVGLEKAELYSRLEQLVVTDELTGLFSRRFLLESLPHQVRLSARTGLPFSLLIADIDHFKRVNDTLGHAAGDRVLATVGRQMREVFRQSDVAARLGGEEFAILLPATSLADADLAAERLRAAIEAGGSGVTVSIGACGFPAGTHVDGEKIAAVAAALLEGADQAMYSSKAGGRNRVTTKPLSEAPEAAVSCPGRSADSTSHVSKA